MTLPFERTRSLVMTKEFLQRLLDPKQTPRVPRPVRGHAHMLLRHFPTLGDIDLVHQALPNWFGPVQPVPRQVEVVVSASTTGTKPAWPLVDELLRDGGLTAAGRRSSSAR